MRTLRTATFVIAAFAAVAPAAGQIVGRPNYGRVERNDPFLGNGQMPGPALWQELRDVDRRIDRAEQSGAITRREARQLRREAAGIAHSAYFYRHGGLSASERYELRTRVDVLRDSVNRQGLADGGKGR